MEGIGSLERDESHPFEYSVLDENYTSLFGTNQRPQNTDVAKNFASSCLSLHDANELTASTPTTSQIQQLSMINPTFADDVGMDLQDPGMMQPSSSSGFPLPSIMSLSLPNSPQQTPGFGQGSLPVLSPTVPVSASSLSYPKRELICVECGCSIGTSGKMYTCAECSGPMHQRCLARRDPDIHRGCLEELRRSGGGGGFVSSGSGFGTVSCSTGHSSGFGSRPSGLGSALGSTGSGFGTPSGTHLSGGKFGSTTLSSCGCGGPSERPKRDQRHMKNDNKVSGEDWFKSQNARLDNQAAASGSIQQAIQYLKTNKCCSTAAQECVYAHIAKSEKRPNRNSNGDKNLKEDTIRHRMHREIDETAFNILNEAKGAENFKETCSSAGVVPRLTRTLSKGEFEQVTLKDEKELADDSMKINSKNNQYGVKVGDAIILISTTNKKKTFEKYLHPVQTKEAVTAISSEFYFECNGVWAGLVCSVPHAMIIKKEALRHVLIYRVIILSDDVCKPTLSLIYPKGSKPETKWETYDIRKLGFPWSIPKANTKKQKTGHHSEQKSDANNRDTNVMMAPTSSRPLDSIQVRPMISENNVIASTLRGERDIYKSFSEGDLERTEKMCCILANKPEPTKAAVLAILMRAVKLKYLGNDALEVLFENDMHGVYRHADADEKTKNAEKIENAKKIKNFILLMKALVFAMWGKKDNLRKSLKDLEVEYKNLNQYEKAIYLEHKEKSCSENEVEKRQKLSRDAHAMFEGLYENGEISFQEYILKFNRYILVDSYCLTGVKLYKPEDKPIRLLEDQKCQDYSKKLEQVYEGIKEHNVPIRIEFCFQIIAHQCRFKGFKVPWFDLEKLLTDIKDKSHGSSSLKKYHEKWMTGQVRAMQKTDEC